jgi:DNA polymerase III subunit delta'
MPWKDLKSQPVISSLYQKAIAQGRLHQAYLLIGDSKESEAVALALAQSLNCEKLTGDFCGECASCLSIAKGQHPDIHLLKPESKSRRILIAQVREIEKAVFLKASRAKRKFVVIQCADRLQPEAQDAILKTLEEPPPATTFLLLTEEPQQLRETMLSRCLKLLLRPGEPVKTTTQEQVEAWLEEFSAKDKVPSDVIRTYRLVGNILGLLKSIREAHLESITGQMDPQAIQYLEGSQKERIEDQLEAQAQAEYLKERQLLVRTMLEWYHRKGAGEKPFRVLNELSRQLGRNINESLTWEVSMLKLAGC